MEPWPANSCQMAKLAGGGRIKTGKLQVQTSRSDLLEHHRSTDLPADFIVQNHSDA